MKKISKAIWGIILIAIGALLALRALDIIDFEIFFDGWWTLFIIVPCTIGLFTERDKMGNLVGLCIGLGLLLASRDVLSFGMLWKLILPLVVVAIGIKLIIGTFRTRESEKIKQRIAEKAGDSAAYCSTFSGQEVNFDGQEFHGVDLTAIFGGIDCDLSRAIITEDAYINITTVFGGVDVILPPDVNVKLNGTGIFGGMSSEKHKNSDPTRPTVYINGTCIFGGAEIK